MNLTLQTIPSTIVSEFLLSKFDGVVLDLEHGCFNNETLLSCIQIITLSNKLCFARVTHLDKTLVRMCLDAGISGIIFSTVESYNQAKEIIDFCHYPKYNGRRGCGLVRENKWGKLLLAARKPIIVAQLETKAAVHNLTEIIDVDFDFYFVGPFDLTNSLMCPGNWNNENYLSYLKTIYQVIPKEKLGIFLPTLSTINSFQHFDKFSVFVRGIDIDFLKEGIWQYASIN